MIPVTIFLVDKTASVQELVFRSVYGLSPDERPTVSPAFYRAIENSSKALEEALNLDVEEVRAKLQAEQNERVEKVQEDFTPRRKELKRKETVLSQLHRWNPSDPWKVSLRDDLLDELESQIQSDKRSIEYREKAAIPVEITYEVAQGWIDEAISRAKRNVETAKTALENQQYVVSKQCEEMDELLRSFNEEIADEFEGEE